MALFVFPCTCHVCSVANGGFKITYGMNCNCHYVSKTVIIHIECFKRDGGYVVFSMVYQRCSLLH